jgi:hypothetical protein
MLGLTYEPVTAAALGFDTEDGREGLATLDRNALSSVVGAAPDAPPVPAHEPPAQRPRPTLKAVMRDRLPLSPAAKSALQDAGRPMRRGHRIEAREVLLRLLDLDRPDPGAALLDTLGVDRAAVREKLAA